MNEFQKELLKKDREETIRRLREEPDYLIETLADMIATWKASLRTNQEVQEQVLKPVAVKKIAKQRTNALVRCREKVKKGEMFTELEQKWWDRASEKERLPESERWKLEIEEEF